MGRMVRPGWACSTQHPRDPPFSLTCCSCVFTTCWGFLLSERDQVGENRFHPDKACCVCVHVCACVLLSGCTRVPECAYVCTSACAAACVYTSVYINACVCACICVHICVLLWACTLLCVLVCIYHLNAGVQFRQFGHACSPGRSSCPLDPSGLSGCPLPTPPAPGLQQLPGGRLSTASSGPVGQKEAGPSDQTRREGCAGRGSAPGGCLGRARVSVLSGPHCASQAVTASGALGSLCARCTGSPVSPLQSLLPSGCVSVGWDLQGFRLRREPALADHHPVLA